MKPTVYGIVSALVASLITGIVLWPARPASGPEPIAWGRDSCRQCGMLISQEGFGGEIRAADGTLTKYDDARCLLEAKAQLTEEPQGVWLVDHATGNFVPEADAILVRGGRVNSPMGSSVAAFADAGRADAFAAETGASRASREEVLASLGTAPGGAAVTLKATPGKPRPLSAAEAADGKAVFLRECSGCHGERADGQGLAAAFLDPKPRSFTRPTFKLRSTASGRPPSTTDILRTIERGIAGTGMPSFSFLSAAERRQAAAFVLRAAGMLDQVEPEPIPDPGTPPPATEATVARGKELYATLECGKCHGASGKGDGPSAATLKDTQGNPIRVRDFTGGEFRGGSERIDLYYRFVTGLDGTPMPSFADSIHGADRWALVDYIMALRVKPEARPYPGNPLAAGRIVAEKYSCRACHKLDDGVGSDVGPDLRVSGSKLGSEWVRTFLKDSRSYGKIYPWRVSRMPALPLDDAEVDVVVRYLAAMGGRDKHELSVPDVASFPSDRLTQGQTYFLLRCTECHTLGTVIETPLAKRQGPDLIRVANRVSYAWAEKWILDPKKIDPHTKMTNPGITTQDVADVRMFVWKTAVENAARSVSSAQPSARQ